MYKGGGEQHQQDNSEAKMVAMRDKGFVKRVTVKSGD